MLKEHFEYNLVPKVEAYAERADRMYWRARVDLDKYLLLEETNQIQIQNETLRIRDPDLSLETILQFVETTANTRLSRPRLLSQLSRRHWLSFLRSEPVSAKHGWLNRYHKMKIFSSLYTGISDFKQKLNISMGVSVK
jgi:hypothetical protein